VHSFFFCGSWMPMGYTRARSCTKRVCIDRRNGFHLRPPQQIAFWQHQQRGEGRGGGGAHLGCRHVLSCYPDSTRMQALPCTHKFTIRGDPVLPIFLPHPLTTTEAPSSAHEGHAACIGSLPDFTIHAHARFIRSCSATRVHTHPKKLSSASA